MPADPRSVLVVGHGDLAKAVNTALADGGAAVTWLREPTDRQLRGALGQARSVVVVFRDDILALRYALLVEHLRPGVRLTVTIFGRTVATQLARAVPDCRVISLADAAVPALTAACLDPELLFAKPSGRDLIGVRAEGGGPRPFRAGLRRPGALARALGWVRSQLRPLDIGSRMLLLGACGIAVILVVESAAAAFGLGAGGVASVYSAVKTVATVGPNPLADDGPTWFKVLSSGGILLAGVFSVVFTAGLVNRLLEPRLTGIVGSRTIPRSGHVVVVGLGQVGLRLSLALREAGVPVVAVESNPEAPNVRIARDQSLPVVIGHGGSRHLLERLSLRRARALAAVTSGDSSNVAISVAALAANPDIRVVLRAGDGEVSAETQALFRIGVTYDVLRLGGALLAASALDMDADAAFMHHHMTHLVTSEGECVPFPPARRTGRR